MSVDGSFRSAMTRALELLSEAMNLVDAYDGPPDAATHLAIAQKQLRQALGRLERP
jgi:hypothetical protein